MTSSRHDAARELLPDFGRIQHLPHKPNTDRGDLIATAEEASIIFRSKCVTVEEKIDGTQVGAAFDGDVPIIRNKNHVLVKGYGHKNTPAKKQYAPLWNWVYEHAERFRKVSEAVGGPVGIYGEWIFAEHTIRYDKAPEDFIAYEVVDDGRFLDPRRAREILEGAEFSVPHLLMWHFSDGDSISPKRADVFYGLLEDLTLQPSCWSTRDRREGVMVKVGDGEHLLARFKMRRSDFKPREDFNDGPILRRAR